MVSVIIFDYDDTLVNSSKALYKIEVRVIKSMSLKVPSEKEYFSLWGLPHSSMIKSMFPNISINEYMKRYSDIYNPDSIKPFKCTLNVVNSLSKKYRLAVLSSKSMYFLKQHLEHTKLYEYMDYVHAEDSSVYKKPDPRVFDDIIAHFDCQPSDMLYVGDQLGDFKAASGAGLDFVAVTTGMNSRSQFNSIGCKNVIGSLASLYTIV